MTPALILRKARTLARRSKLEKVWFLPVFVLLGLAALALRVHRIPYLLCLGVAKDEAKGLKAHAWVATDRVAVTGGRSFLGFAVVGAFEYGGNE